MPYRDDFRPYVILTIRHCLALGCSVAFCSVTAFALYAVPVFADAKTAADLGGPLNFLIVPAFGWVAGAVLGLLFYLPLTLVAEVIDLRSRARPFGGAVSVLGISLGLICFGLSAVVTVSWTTHRTLSVLWSATLYVFLGFLGYVTCIWVFRTLLLILKR